MKKILTAILLAAGNAWAVDYILLPGSSSAVPAYPQKIFCNQTNNWLANGDKVDFVFSGRLPASDFNTLVLQCVSDTATNFCFVSSNYLGVRWDFTWSATRDANTNLNFAANFTSDDTNFSTLSMFDTLTNCLPLNRVVFYTLNSSEILTRAGFSSPTYFEPAVTKTEFNNWTNAFSGGGGGGGGLTDLVVTGTNLPAGSAAYATNTGTIAGIAYINIGIPRGSNGTNGTNGTNTVTAYAFTNQWLGSRQIATYSSNYLSWGTSNFLARVPGISDWQLAGGALGGGGLAPPTNVFIQLVGSYNGSNSWFVLTNNFATSNTISIAATGAGGGQGFATLFNVDHWELFGRTNYGFGQTYVFGSPKSRSNPADKAYVDDSILNATSSAWTTSVDTNQVAHFSYVRSGVTLADFGEVSTWIPITSATLDGSGVNLLLTVAQTNLITGWFMDSNTNLLAPNSWQQWTNYTSATNTGIVTFTIPIDFSEPMRFFRTRAPAMRSFVLTAPLTALGGTCYTSNSWSLATVTNGMANMSFWTGSSNGQALVSVWLSNGVPWIKRLSP